MRGARDPCELSERQRDIVENVDACTPSGICRGERPGEVINEVESGRCILYLLDAVRVDLILARVGRQFASGDDKGWNGAA